jgi:hypothetical protein
VQDVKRKKVSSETRRAEGHKNESNPVTIGANSFLMRPSVLVGDFLPLHIRLGHLLNNSRRRAAYIDQGDKWLAREFIWHTIIHPCVHMYPLSSKR